MSVWQTCGIQLLDVVYGKIGSTKFRLALRPTQPPIQWVPQALPLGREADHSFINFIHPGVQNTLIQDMSMQLIHYEN
jgi:hypothetical protein